METDTFCIILLRKIHNNLSCFDSFTRDEVAGTSA